MGGFGRLRKVERGRPWLCRAACPIVSSRWAAIFLHASHFIAGNPSVVIATEAENNCADKIRRSEKPAALGVRPHRVLLMAAGPVSLLDPVLEE
jgi:hypothetical protein